MLPGFSSRWLVQLLTHCHDLRRVRLRTGWKEGGVARLPWRDDYSVVHFHDFVLVLIVVIGFRIVAGVRQVQNFATRGVVALALLRCSLRLFVGAEDLVGTAARIGDRL